MIDILSIIAFIQNNDHSVFDSFFVFGFPDSGELIDLFDLLQHAVSDGRTDLAAVLPVGFISVVVLRIVGCSDIDTGDGMQKTDRISQLRSGPQGRIDIGLDPVGSQYACGKQTEFSGFMTAVMSDDDASVHGLLAIALDEIGYALRCSANHVDIHTVGSGFQFASQSGRTESDVLIESLFDLLLISGKTRQLRMKRIVVVHPFQPFPIFFFCVHFFSFYFLHASTNCANSLSTYSSPIISSGCHLNPKVNFLPGTS